MIYFVAAIAGIAGILFGFDEGVIAGALHLLHGRFQITSFDEGLMTAAVPLGALFGALVAGRAADKYGRRSTLLGAAILFILGAIASSLITAIWMLSAARILLGIAVGIAAMVAPLYISENAPAAKRGMLIAIYQLAVTMGILGAYLVNFSLDDNWRTMFLVGAIPGLALLVGMFFLNDTPRWLVANGRHEQARGVLAKLREAPENSSTVTQELTEIELACADERGNVAKWSELFSPIIRPALIVGIGLFFLQQLSGINAVIYYAPSIFRESGFDSGSTQLLATIGIGVVNVAMTVVGMALIDRIGRRRLLILGFIGTSLSLGMIVLGAATDIAWLDTAATVGLVLYIASFAASIGPLPWVMMAEIFPRKVRGLGMSAVTVANWGFNFLVVFSFPVLMSWLGLGGVFAIYAAACVVGLFFTLRFVPETSGISLEHIEAHLKSGRPFHQLRAPATIPDPQAIQDSLALPPGQMDQLLAAVLAHSPYRKVLTPMIAQISPLAYDNHQIRIALHAIWTRAKFAQTGVLSRSHLGPQQKTLSMFLEHIRYASPDFLTSIGEGQELGKPI